MVQDGVYTKRGYGAMLSLRSKLLLVGAVLVATFMLSAAQADAQCCWYRPVAWTYYTTYYTACYTPCYYGTYGAWYLGWRPGPIRRLILGPYRWYWAGYGGWYGDCCWTTTAWYDCCVGDVSVPAAPQPAGQPTPAQPTPQPTPEATDNLEKLLQPTPPVQTPKTPVETPKTEPSPPAGGTLPPAGGLLPPSGAPTSPLPGLDPMRMPGPSGAWAPTPADSGLLTVVVPFDAKVYINGLETKSTGSRRQFVSYGLKPGYSYRYDIRVELVRDGKLEVATMTKVLKAGSREFATFPFQKPDEEFAALP